MPPIRRATLEFIRRMLDGMTKMVIATPSHVPDRRFQHTQAYTGQAAGMTLHFSLQPSA